jgi:glyoxylase-like metal-dependent hydrolase (beta-lactamase superfamily II)
MTIQRRDFVRGALGCIAWLAGGLSLLPWSSLRAFSSTPRFKVVAEEDFARIEQVADGVWAVVSTPLKDGGKHFATTANGGIVAGKDGVLVVEGYYSDEGAAWLARQARTLTGREPTQVVVTHYHADHTRGLGGLSEERPDDAAPLRMLTTPKTKQLLIDNDEPVVPEGGIADAGDAMSIDLGDRKVRLVPRMGHTASDVTVEIDEPGVVWCGDLVWNGMFPNYVDAIPTHLTAACEAILGREDVIYVPGHGDLGDAAALAPYLGVIRDIGAAARRAIEKGTPAKEAAAAYTLPGSLGEWQMFSADYFERAFVAWERELAGSDR